MTDKNNDEPSRYATYKGLGITPMIGGVPLFLALVLVGFIAIAMVFLIAGKPFFAIALLVGALAVYFIFKVACENNNKAPQVIKMQAIGFSNILKYGKIIKVDLGVDSNYEKRKKFQRGFKSLFESK